MSSSVLALLEPSLPGMLTTAATAQIVLCVNCEHTARVGPSFYGRTAPTARTAWAPNNTVIPAAQACKALPRFGGACVSAHKGSPQCSESYRNTHTRDFDCRASSHYAVLKPRQSKQTPTPVAQRCAHSASSPRRHQTAAKPHPKPPTALQHTKPCRPPATARRTRASQPRK